MYLQTLWKFSANPTLFLEAQSEVPGRVLHTFPLVYNEWLTAQHGN